MALITHLAAIKNSNYNQALQYLTKKHTEVQNAKGETVKYDPIYNSNGELMERENYRITYLNSDGQSDDIKNWARDCYTTNLKYNQNMKENDRKAHHYVVSFPVEDFENGLTVEKAQHAVEEFCKKIFPGHQLLIATHGDTDNIHVHIVLNSVRAKEVPQEKWMTKMEDGIQIKPSQYKAGGKHTNTSELRLHLMQEVDMMCKKYGFAMENYSCVRRKSKARKRMEYMHTSVIAASLKSKDFSELQSNLEAEFHLKIDVRGHSIRVFHPDLMKPKRIEHLGLTPYDLPEDMHHYYDFKSKEYELMVQRWEEEEREYMNSIAKNAKEAVEGQIYYEEDEVKRKGWAYKDFHYSVSRYDEDGRMRCLAEELIILALVVINGERPDFVLTEAQRSAKAQHEARLDRMYFTKKEKLENLNKALRYIKELEIETPEIAKSMLKDTTLSVDTRKKVVFVYEQLLLTADKKYCYETEYSPELEVALNGLALSDTWKNKQSRYELNR